MNFFLQDHKHINKNDKSYLLLLEFYIDHLHQKIDLMNSKYTTMSNEGHFLLKYFLTFQHLIELLSKNYRKSKIDLNDRVILSFLDNLSDNLKTRELNKKELSYVFEIIKKFRKFDLTEDEKLLHSFKGITLYFNNIDLIASIFDITSKHFSKLMNFKDNNYFQQTNLFHFNINLIIQILDLNLLFLNFTTGVEQFLSRIREKKFQKFFNNMIENNLLKANPLQQINNTNKQLYQFIFEHIKNSHPEIFFDPNLNFQRIKANVDKLIIQNNFIEDGSSTDFIFLGDFFLSLSGLKFQFDKNSKLSLTSR